MSACYFEIAGLLRKKNGQRIYRKKIRVKKRVTLINLRSRLGHGKSTNQTHPHSCCLLPVTGTAGAGTAQTKGIQKLARSFGKLPG